MSSKTIILSGCLILNEKNELLLLRRKDHHWYETPGGKIKLEECANPKKPKIEELAKAALREAHEELGKKISLSPFHYFGKIALTLPDGRKAVAHKFLTRIVKGKPLLNEPGTFTQMRYMPLDHAKKYLLSPDLQMLLPKLLKKLQEKKVKQRKVSSRHKAPAQSI